jgi:hypothetical protein
MVLEGTTDTENFRAYVGEPTLRRGDLVIMDNLSPHKSDPTLAFFGDSPCSDFISFECLEQRFKL